MNNSSSAASNIAIWERAIQPARRSLEAAYARALLEMKLSKRDLDRADALAARATQRKLSDEEQLLFPASGAATRSFNGLHPKSKFLAPSGQLEILPETLFRTSMTSLGSN